MQHATVPVAARQAIAGHLAGLGLPPESREGLILAMEQGMAAGEADAFALRDRLVFQATVALTAAVGRVADEIADVVLAPAETLGLTETRGLGA